MSHCLLGEELRSTNHPFSAALGVTFLPDGRFLLNHLSSRLPRGDPRAVAERASRYHTVWHLMNVAVEPRHRRQRVATMLIERLFETAGDHDRYTLEVRVSNDEAIAMYEHFGFREAGLRRRYYHDNNEDALIMWRTRG